jgi:D-alanine-D-alanine ligase
MRNETLNRLKGIRVGVLLGGMSNEREVSLRTGAAVLDSLKRMGVDAVGIDAGRDLAEHILREKIGLAFIALHGRYGEDGCVQGLLEVMGIPYTGSGVAASSIAMSKKLTKSFCFAAGAPTAPYRIVTKRQFESAMVSAPMKAPCVVKPVSGGSSLNVSICMRDSEVVPAIEAALSGDPEAMVEMFIPGKLITAGVVGGRALPAIEIETRSGFYDYANKYTPGNTVYHLPARLDAKILAVVEETALKIHNAIGARGQTRSELIVDDGGTAWFLEINTIPGMTETSLLPKAAAHAGMMFGDLVLEICGQANWEA